MIAKLSGIGCSSKTPTYFVSGAHGFNSAHGRMAAIATGANAANRELTYIGISGDGDSLSIGLGHMCHAIRRNVKMLYVIENNGVYGLTKGQFSASADVGSKSKRGEPNRMAPIDPVMLGLSLGATFVARSFSGDKEQLVPILKAALAHRGFALVDVISPCVTFNDHDGSTKSYLYTRKHDAQGHRGRFRSAGLARFSRISARTEPPASPCTTAAWCASRACRRITIPPIARRFTSYLQEHHGGGEVVTGLLYRGRKRPRSARDEPDAGRTALASPVREDCVPARRRWMNLQEDIALLAIS